jgi:5-methylcytosine-specific restriction endonuclease McrA
MAKVKKQLVPRTRNNNTMTDSEFFGRIRGLLRKSSMWWKPIIIAKQKAKRAYSGDNKMQKWEYQCNHCKLWFKDKDTVVDHIIPAGTLTKYEDLPDFCEKLFVEEGGYQVLCKPCHQLKTNSERKPRKSKKNEKSI